MVIRPLASSQMARLHDSVVGQVHIIEGLISILLSRNIGIHCKSSLPCHDKVIGSLMGGRLLQKKAHSCIAVPTLWI